MAVFNVLKCVRPRDEPLSEASAIEAQAAAAAAALGLYEDALLLYRNGRKARAAALAVLALEEVGKIKVLARIASAPDAAARKAAWAEYRAHLAKAGENIAAGPGLSDEEVRSSFAREADSLKQLGFYSNLIDSGRWVWPEAAISDRDAQLALTWAEVMVKQLPAA